ncbi:hypothetical protein U1P98_18665 [Lysinibacillus irui]|uniref:Phage protein n=1 Tax=Lysinibacillus irui TaxID=2998077 RepID=A0ABU5NQL5_9BACI|nr:hypothetical protein [Lysinibacillus irui]MEA0556079.1 hypothetical protein [Lysinibacillus irui]MEA0978333.1 hypothetical protein [Lysinibacillus irui]MEA1044487.1 hypothetical protein [Lysinibacillus irui]
MSTEQFLVLCKECGLSHDDLETMTFGMCLDYIEQYLEMKNPNKKQKKNVRKASQADFDSF